jgi:uncharacterized protein YoxC
MNARQAALEHYGGRPPRCAYCASTEALELDHRDGEGNVHRRGIQTTLPTWLRQHDYPADYPITVLCHRCHVLKGRGRMGEDRMPSGSGDKAAKNFYLRKDVITALERLAKAKGVSVSQAVEDLVMQASETPEGHTAPLLAHLHDRHNAMADDVREINTSLAYLVTAARDLDRSVKGLHGESGILTRILDVVNRLESWSKKGWFSR